MSFINCLIQIAYLVAEAQAVYFSLVKDNIIVVCFWFCKEITPLANINT